LPRRFEITLHSCYLYVTSELVKAFGEDPSFDGALGPALERLLLAAIGVLGSLREVSARPDVADDAFLLAGRALSYAPRLVITSRLLPVLLATVHSGLLVQHREACCSITAFMLRLLDPATLRKCPPSATSTLQTALAPVAPGIVRLTLAGALGALPGSRLKDLTDVLYAILKVTGGLGFEWTAAAVGVLPEEGATLADKQQFLSVCQMIVADGIAVDDEQKLVAALEELSDCCRRNRKAQAATLRVLLPPELQYLV
jgi:transportin-3